MHFAIKVYVCRGQWRYIFSGIGFNISLKVFSSGKGDLNIQHKEKKKMQIKYFKKNYSMLYCDFFLHKLPV